MAEVLIKLAENINIYAIMREYNKAKWYSVYS